MIKPLDLKNLFGLRFIIELDPAASCEPGGKTDPWYYQIPGKHGHIYPFSDKLLAYHCTGQKIRARLHRDHPELEVRQWTDDGEAVFLFTTLQFDMIAKYAQPRKRRRLSMEHRQKLAESNRSHRFLSENHGTQSSSDDRQGRFSEKVTPETRGDQVMASKPTSEPHRRCPDVHCDQGYFVKEDGIEATPAGAQRNQTRCSRMVAVAKATKPLPNSEMTGVISVRCKLMNLNDFDNSGV